MVSKKSQIWYADLLIGIVIFSVALVIYFKTDLNLYQGNGKIYQDLMMEAKIITNSLISPGYPFNWTPGTVTRLGFVDNARVNYTKLNYLMGMNYNHTKSLLRTKYDYYFYFEQYGRPALINGSDGYGYPGVNRTNLDTLLNPKYVLKLTRIVILNHNPARMQFLIWKKD